jgi:hypothetical protein
VETKKEACREGMLYKHENKYAFAIFTAETKVGPETTIRINDNILPSVLSKELEVFDCGSFFIYKLYYSDINDVNKILIGHFNCITIEENSIAIEYISLRTSFSEKTGDFITTFAISLFLQKSFIYPGGIEFLKESKIAAFFVLNKLETGELGLEKKGLIINSLKPYEKFGITHDNDSLIAVVLENGQIQLCRSYSMGQIVLVYTLFFIFVILVLLLLLAGIFMTMGFFKRRLTGN